MCKDMPVCLASLTHDKAQINNNEKSYQQTLKKQIQLTYCTDATSIKLLIGQLGLNINFSCHLSNRTSGCQDPFLVMMLA